MENAGYKSTFTQHSALTTQHFPMIVRSLRIQNFRNYTAQEIELPEGISAFLGENGQGKTNLLEAICVLATTKSPLVDRDRELIRWEQREARLGAKVQTTLPYPQERTLEYIWKVKGNGVSRQMRLQGIPQDALMYWLGQLQVVAFFPHDLVIVHGEPAERRRFINVELGKNNHAHFHDTLRYRRVLQQRNSLLRQFAEHKIAKSTFTEQLRDWNHQLIGYGSRVFSQRALFIHELAPLAQQVHQTLAGTPTHFSIRYLPGLGTPVEDTQAIHWKEAFRESLERNHANECRRGTTQSGPHRDDLELTLDGIELRKFGSQGQQRLAILAMKLALARWTQQINGEAPILLLDDAFSELDARRRKCVLEFAHEFPQTFITATDAAFLEGVPATLWKVAAGGVQKYFS